MRAQRLYAIVIGYIFRVAMDIVRRQILTRLGRGPAEEGALARWCDSRLHLIRPKLDAMVLERRIVFFAGRYALPFTRRYPRPRNLAGPVVIPQFRWGSTRLA